MHPSPAPVSLRTRVARAAVLAPLFGLALTGNFALVWLRLERAWTDKATLALAIIAGSAMLAGFMAGLVALPLTARPLPLRILATFVTLVAGTTGFASFALFVAALWTTSLPADSLGHAIFFAVTLGSGAVFSFMALGAPLLFVPGLPLLFLFAWMLALPGRRLPSAPRYAVRERSGRAVS